MRGEQAGRSGCSPRMADLSGLKVPTDTPPMEAKLVAELPVPAGSSSRNGMASVALSSAMEMKSR